VASLFVSRWDSDPGQGATDLRDKLGRPSVSGPIRHIAMCWTPIAGNAWKIWVRDRSGCSSPAPAPKIQGVRCALYRSLGCAEYGQHHARKNSAGLRTTWQHCKPIPRDGGDCEQVLSEFTKAGIDLIKLAADLQSEGAKSFDESWQDLLKSIDTKSKALR